MVLVNSTYSKPFRVLFCGAFFIALFFCANKARCQTPNDVSFAYTLSQGQVGHKAIIAHTAHISPILYGPYLFYKHFVSSQDGNACSFYPSCANYGVGSISEHGLFPGILLTFDRLTRCNAFSQADEYDWYYPAAKLYDPVTTTKKKE